jgi:hypothetical protein
LDEPDAEPAAADLNFTVQDAGPATCAGHHS